MKLATYKDGSRDGQLVVVSRDLSTAHYATGIADTLQQVLDDWNFIAPQLQDLSVTLNQGRARHAFAFDPRMCMAPLPRAIQWVTGEDTRSAVRGTEAVPPSLVVCGGDALRGPTADLVLTSDSLGADIGAGLAAMVDDIPQGAPPARALEGIRLMALSAETVLHQCLPQEGAPSAGVPLARPDTAFSPVAVTPDEWGEAWHAGRVHLVLQSTLNGRKMGMLDATDMAWSFAELLSCLARGRPLQAGTIVGSGIWRHPAQPGDGAPTWPRGHGCLAHRRAAEIRLHGQAISNYLTWGDEVLIDMKGADGMSVCGAIHRVVRSAG